MEVKTPKIISDKLLQLNNLVDRFPEDIPVDEAAKFLGCDGRSIRGYLISNFNAFGMGWKQDGKANRGFHIPTAKFYLWYTNGMLL